MKTIKRNYLTIGLYFFILAMIVLAFTAAANAEKAPPSAPTDYQWSIYWGETGHILCYESPTAKEQGQPPAGILNFDVTGSDVVTITCRQPGTVKDGQ